MQKITYTTDDDGNQVKQTWAWTLLSEELATPAETAAMTIIEEMVDTLPNDIDPDTRQQLAEKIAKRMSKDKLI